MRFKPTATRTVGVWLTALLATSACGSSNLATTPTAGEPTRTVERAAEPAEVEAPDTLAFEAKEPALSESATENLVEFEAAWQCDLSRFAVKELTEINEMLLAHRATFGVTDGDYADFQQQLSTDAALRAAVASETSQCLDAGEPVQL